MENNEKVIKS